MEVKDIIKNRRIELQLTMKQVADMINVSEGTISRWESGEIANMRRDKIVALANALRLSPSVIMGWEDDPPQHTYKTVMIPLLASVSCGPGILATDNIEGYVDIPDSLSGTGEFFALSVKGDSMEPDLHDGDVVIVRKQEDAETGDMVIAKINGEDGVCKRLKKYEDCIALESLNSKYPPRYFRLSEIESKPVYIVGRVIESRRKY